MSNSPGFKSFPSGFLTAMEDDEDRLTLFDVVHGRMTEKVALQQLIMVTSLPSDPPDTTELGACYEHLIVHLNIQHKWGQAITGLLIIYPSCLLHIIEASEHLLECFLNDLQAMQKQPHCVWLETKIVFMGHNVESRQFQQWSYKVMNAGPDVGNSVVRKLEEDEESIESLVCSVLMPLQSLVKHLKPPEVLLGPVLGENPDLIIPPLILEKLLCRDELLSPQQYLQMYHSPLNINIEYGQVNLRSFF